MKVYIALIVCLAGITLPIYLGLQKKDRDPGKLVTLHKDTNTAFVTFSNKDAEHLEEGDIVEFTNQKGETLTGTLLSKNDWFHRTMTKVKVSKNLARKKENSQKKTN